MNSRKNELDVYQVRVYHDGQIKAPEEIASIVAYEKAHQTSKLVLTDRAHAKKLLHLYQAVEPTLQGGEVIKFIDQYNHYRTVYRYYTPEYEKTTDNLLTS